MQENISVNFVELEYLSEKLMKHACETETTANYVKAEARFLADMALYNYADMVDICGNGIADISDEIALLGRKLKRIASLYEDAEREQVLNVQQLPDKAETSESMARGIKISSSALAADTVNVGEFYGHYIENEEWFDNLIMDWRLE